MISRRALEELGSDTWAAALDYLYAEAMVRPVRSESYPRAAGGSSATRRPRPAPPRLRPRPTRCSGSSASGSRPNQYNAAHPRSFSYFTPPPLAMSIAGEVLAQWVNQGVDVWHAGPSAAFVEEEVVAWLRDAARLHRRWLGRAHVRAA